MTLRDTPRFPIVAAAFALAVAAAPALASDPPATDDPPAGDSVLDAMPHFVGAAGEPTGGEGGLDRPGLGDRPTPAEARRRGEIGETLMRPRGGSAAGGKPDVPLER